MVVSFIRQLIFLVPAAFLLALWGHNTGNSNLVWWCYPLAEVVALGLSFFFYFRLHRTLLSSLPDDGEIAREAE